MPERSIATTGTPIVGNVDKRASVVGLALDMVLVRSCNVMKTFVSMPRSRKGPGEVLSSWGGIPVSRALLEWGGVGPRRVLGEC